MAFIDSGPVDATDRFEATPKSKWPHLMRAKRTFLATKLNYDCRCLVEFCEEAESVWQELGFDSAEDMIRNGYELDPVEIELAVAWLRHNEPEEAISLNGVSDEIAKADAIKDKQKRGPKPKDSNSANLAEIDMSGTSNQNILRRLLREEKTELIKSIESGEMSVNQAAIAAGYRKKLSESEKCVRAFRKAENRLEALKLIVDDLEPHERAVVSDWLGNAG